MRFGIGVPSPSGKCSPVRPRPQRAFAASEIAAFADSATFHLLLPLTRRYQFRNGQELAVVGWAPETGSFPTAKPSARAICYLRPRHVSLAACGHVRMSDDPMPSARSLR